MFQTLLVNPFLQAIHGIAVLFNDNYGISIIIITLIIRLVLMPFMLKQYKNQQLLKSKMESIKPEMDKIQEKIKNTKDKEEQQKLQQEVFALYRQHGVNPFNMGCLPLLIQMPILMGLYYAIRGSHEIATHSFLWFSLGQPNLGITLIAGIVYYIQFKVTQQSMPVAQQNQMKIMGLLSPIMIVIFSINSPAALPLYWAVGGTFLVFQSLVSRKIYNSDRGMKNLGNEIG
ncbi:membrane protein insertase, YidC/Oxa1 family, C-terminal domain [Schinkia azotoformans MEV2011]|uniref:Membrane protein insertase, YidC/Oxa1 family, C-terminal domain n=1 Tax=Schinkia azotoformans MEV2011 TaxID=1348973 RepID=A0A072NEG2_SCHAZ|nr:membrane protein insertase YidC [Schinkia azotoformans]KEF35946.1 preprotein translocase subunit YidC [Schinkia azotoformans MEV2011]KEF39715.1 membrane protein insertase, YidC/Oxa1 family, C-terminal domain [Schinkia azotoformans MEV2011]MEC1695066.1 membrane protein insertase YidC [Schinkia azotoformans]MEC1726871.1 membrane protein insertase YidC [Schinkia azotoformans]MEC1781874.1 membrane protein insertase YidC [Schinkia azotoformans]